MISLPGPRWLLAALVAATHAPGLAGLPFERVGSPSGPPSGVVTAVCRDRAGFLWIGSINGLSLYDGHTFTSWVHDPSDPSSISDDAIRTIFEDSRGALWVGTNTGGLNRLDRATGSFARFRHDSGNPGSLSHDSVYAIAEDRGGALWVGTQRGLNRLAPGSDTFERFLEDTYAGSLLVDGEGRLWVGTVGRGLLRWEATARRFDAYRHDPADPGSLGHNSVFRLLEHPAGVLWVGNGLGLDRLDVPRMRFRRYPHRAGSTGGPSYPIVSSLAPAAGERIWVGTFGGGLDALDPATGTFESHRHERSEPRSIPSNRVLDLVTDGTGALWVATLGGGLSRVSPSALLIASGAERFHVPDELADRDLTALEFDREGALWLGTRDGTLLRRDPATGAYRSYGDRSPGSVLRIHVDRRGDVWAGAARGLARYDVTSGAATYFGNDPSDSASLGPGFVPALLAEADGTFWVGTGEGGVQELDSGGRVRRRFRHDPADPESLSDDYVTVLRRARDGTLWVGTRSGGLNSLDTASGRIVRYRTVPDDPYSIGHHNVTAIHEDRRGRLWIATAGGGLNLAERPDPSSRMRFERITVADGLVDNNVMGIVEDDDGSLWLSTKRGLSRYAPDSGIFANYLVADGLPSGEFEFGSATRSPDALFFGSVQGLTVIPAGSPFPPATASPTVITSVQREREEQGRAATAPERLALPYGAWFAVEIAVLDYSPEHRHAYAYRLREGDEWIDVGARRSITFTDLAPGRYALATRGCNARGVWSESAPLAIEIVPPFWMTLWFRLLVVGAIGGAVVVIYQRRLTTLARRNRELLTLQEQRERANRDLAEAYGRLQHLARRLEAAKEEERKHIARELHDDLGPNLTAVNINLRLLRSNFGDAVAMRRFEDTVDLVDRMVQQIRDLSLDLRPPLLDEMGLLTALRGYLETQAERTGLAIDVVADPLEAPLPPEVEIAAFRAAQEGVTNAIRHAQASRVTVGVRCVDGIVEVDVEDDGRGFDAAGTLAAPATGRHIGLLGLQERARMLGGSFEIDSSPGRGTRVRVRIPLEARR